METKTLRMPNILRAKVRRHEAIDWRKFYAFYASGSHRRRRESGQDFVGGAALVGRDKLPQELPHDVWRWSQVRSHMSESVNQYYISGSLFTIKLQYLASSCNYQGLLTQRL